MERPNAGQQAKQVIYLQSFGHPCSPPSRVDVRLTPLLILYPMTSVVVASREELMQCARQRAEALQVKVHRQRGGDLSWAHTELAGGVDAGSATTG